MSTDDDSPCLAIGCNAKPGPRWALCLKHEEMFSDQRRREITKAHEAMLNGVDGAVEAWQTMAAEIITEIGQIESRSLGKLIQGNTFGHRAQIKALGGRWDPDARGWRVPAAQYDAVMELLDD